MKKNERKLSRKQKRSVKRKLDLEQGVQPFKTKIHKSDKEYRRRPKHGQWEEEDM